MDQDLDKEDLAHGDSSDSLTSLINPDTPVDALNPGAVGSWNWVGNLVDNDFKSVYIVWEVKSNQYVRFDLGHIQEVNTLYMIDSGNKRENIKV